MAPGTNVTLIAGLALAILATVICIVSTAIPYWSNNSLTGEHNGLFQACISFFGLIICARFDDAPSWVKATGAMMVIATFMLVTSSCFAFTFAFVMRTRKLLVTVSGILAFAGGALSMVGVIVYAAKSAQLPASGFSLHAGFGLAIVAALTAFAAGATLLFGRRKADTMY